MLGNILDNVSSIVKLKVLRKVVRFRFKEKAYSGSRGFIAFGAVTLMLLSPFIS